MSPRCLLVVPDAQRCLRLDVPVWPIRLRWRDDAQFT